MTSVEDTRSASPAVLKVLNGAVDLHCHSGPSPFPRRINHVEASFDAARIGMRALLLKSHHHNTVMDLKAMAAQLEAAPTPLYGGIALNTEVGGINPSAVAMSLGMGGRCVWAPTTCAGPHIEHHNHGGSFPSSGFDMREKEVTIYDESGEVSADTVTVTEIIAEADALLAGGHLDPEATKALFTVAAEKGVRRMLLQHPDFIVGASYDDVDELVRIGAYVEHEIAMYYPGTSMAWPVQKLVDWIERVGPEKTVISSDLGQKNNPLPVDGYIYLVGQLLDHGVSEKDIRTVIADNPAFLLGLEEKPA